MNLFKPATNFKLLLLLFALSCLLRLPNLNRPLANQWELCTGISLVQLDIWKKTGAETFNYLLPVNYPGIKDLHIQNWKAYKQAKDEKGNYYYLSFPSFYLLIPYFLNQLFHLPISPLSLQLINICLHFLSLLLILKTCELLFPAKKSHINITGLAACFIYCFSPGPLWFHTNIYLNFFYVIPILLFYNYQFLKIHLSTEAQPKSSFYALQGISLFLLCFTEWIGYLAAFTQVIVSIYFYFKTRKKKYIITGSIAGFTAALALSLYLWQCASAVGWDSTVNYFFYKYDEYSGQSNGSHFLLFLTRFGLWLLRGYAPILLLLAGLLILLKIKNHSIRELFRKNTFLLFLLLLVPSFLRHLLIRDYTINHEYSTMVDGLAISFFGGLLISYIIDFQLINKGRLVMLGFAILILNGISFFLQHFPGPKSINGYPYSVARKIGTQIYLQASKDEAVFLVGYNREYDWQILWYAKTNVGFCKNLGELAKKMQELKLQKAQVFVLDPTYMYTGKVANFKEIQIP